MIGIRSKESYLALLKNNHSFQYKGGEADNTRELRIHLLLILLCLLFETAVTKVEFVKMAVSDKHCHVMETLLLMSIISSHRMVYMDDNQGR